MTNPRANLLPDVPVLRVQLRLLLIGSDLIQINDLVEGQTHDGNQEVEQDDQHKELGEQPVHPNQKNDHIHNCSTTVLALNDLPPLIRRGCEVSNRISPCKNDIWEKVI